MKRIEIISDIKSQNIIKIFKEFEKIHKLNNWADDIAPRRQGLLVEGVVNEKISTAPFVATATKLLMNEK